MGIQFKFPQWEFNVNFHNGNSIVGYIHLIIHILVLLRMSLELCMMSFLLPSYISKIYDVIWDLLQSSFHMYHKYFGWLRSKRPVFSVPSFHRKVSTIDLFIVISKDKDFSQCTTWSVFYYIRRIWLLNNGIISLENLEISYKIGKVNFILSLGGRIVLLNSIISALLLYWMFIYIK